MLGEHGVRGIATSRRGLACDADPVAAGDVTAPEDPAPGLEFKDVSIGWPGSGVVRANQNFHVNPGERVALVGASGTGKTTVAATAMGFIPPLAGRLRRANTVSYLAQDAHIFTTSVAENVRLGNKDATDQQVALALMGAGLEMSADRGGSTKFYGANAVVSPWHGFWLRVENFSSSTSPRSMLTSSPPSP